jgi:hypothetical protein
MPNFDCLFVIVFFCATILTPYNLLFSTTMVIIAANASRWPLRLD